MSLRDLLCARTGLTRRRFLAGGAVATAGTMAAISLVGCSDTKKRTTDGEPQMVTDTSKIVNVLDDYASKDLGVGASATWSLPLGTLLWHSEGSWAAAMLTPESSTRPNTIGALDLSSGALSTLVEAPTLGSAWSFFDVRAADSVYAWVEIDYGELSWTLFARPWTSGSFTGDAVKLDSGDRDWDPPRFTCAGTQVIWLKMPSTAGSKTASPSTCYLWTAGDKQGAGVLESPGRFATPPRVAAQTLTVTPRVRADEGTYYGMTALDLKGDDHGKLDQLVLPAGVQPLEAVYTGKEFVFSIEAAYDAAGSLGQMGTFVGREGGPYVYFGREPVAQVCFNGTKYLVKTQSAHYAFDTGSQQYEGVSSPDRSLGMGDMTASEGEVTQALVYATVRDAKGIPASVTARLLTL